MVELGSYYGYGCGLVIQDSPVGNLPIKRAWILDLSDGMGIACRA